MQMAKSSSDILSKTTALHKEVNSMVIDALLISQCLELSCKTYSKQSTGEVYQMLKA